MRRFHVLLVGCLWMAGGGAAPVATQPPMLLPVAGLRADVDVLQRAYELLHPGLHRYNTPTQMRAHFDTLRKDLDHDQPLAEAYLAFSKFAATVRCGHTYPNFYNQSEVVQKALFQRVDRVPFHFRWLGSRMVVTRDLSADGALPRGSEVLSIEGVPVAEIQAKLMTIARADGANDDKRRALLQVQGEDEFETFDIYLPLFYPQVDGEHTLQVRRPGDDAVRTLTVPAQTHAQRLALRNGRAESETADWSLRFDGDFAVLRMPGWALYDSKWDWKAWLQQSFDDIAARGSKALVIDLRGNEGGLDIGDEILPHLIDGERVVPDPPRRVRYRKVPDDLAPMLDTWDPSFKDWGDAAQPYDDRYYTLTRWQDDAGAATLRPRTPRYAGRVFVLVGADNSSATFQFAQTVQQAGLGTLVGQPTGGNQRGINGGAFFFLRLPNSGIELDLPLIASFPPGDPPDAGLRPDIAVEPTIADIVAGRDAEMAAVTAAMHAP